MRKSSGTIAYLGETAALVILKLFINGLEKRHCPHH